MPEVDVTDETFLRVKQVTAQVGLSRSEIYRRVQAGTFPKQRRRSHKIAVWYGSEINTWKRQQILADLRDLLGD